MWRGRRLRCRSGGRGWRWCGGRRCCRSGLCGGACFERFFEAFARFEFGHSDRWDLHGLFGVLGVHAHAAFAGFGHKRAKASNIEFTAALKCFGDGVYEFFNHVFGLFFGDLAGFGEVKDEFCFIHNSEVTSLSYLFYYFGSIEGVKIEYIVNL